MLFHAFMKLYILLDTRIDTTAVPLLSGKQDDYLQLPVSSRLIDAQNLATFK